MPFYLCPIEKIGYARGPLGWAWRFNRAGAGGHWSLKDFGPSAGLGLLCADDAPMRQESLLINGWSKRQRANVQTVLARAGVESRWVLRAADWREAVQRLAGLTQAMQAGTDNPDEWLSRNVYFGARRLTALRFAPSVVPEAPPPLRVTWPRATVFTWRRLWRVLRLAPLLALMALPATDNFTTATSQALTTYSANWSLNSGNFQVDTTDVVVANASAECGAFWNADSFAAAQYAFLTRTAVGTDWLGPGTRHAGAGTASYYGFYTNGDGSETYVFKMVSGTWTQLGSAGSVNIVAGDVLRLESNGSTHTPIRNGSTYTSIGAQTDSSLSSGSGGLCGYGLATLSNAGDTWEAGNLAGTAFNRSISLSTANNLGGVRSFVGARLASFSQTSAVTPSRAAANRRTASLSQNSTLDAARTATLTRPASLSTASNLSASRAGAFGRAVSLTIANTLSAARRFVGARAVSLSAASSISITGALGALTRSISLSVASVFSASRATTANRVANLSAAHNLTVARIVAVGRAVSLSQASSFSVARGLVLIRALTLSVANSFNTARAATTTRGVALSTASALSAAFQIGGLVTVLTLGSVFGVARAAFIKAVAATGKVKAPNAGGSIIRSP